MRTRSLKWYGVGTLLGAVASVLWLELWLTLVPVAGVITLVWLVAGRSRERWIAAARALAAALVVMAFAHAAPLKFEDQPLKQPLSSAQLSLRQLAVDLEANARVQGGPVVSDAIVHLPSAQPTYRELKEALRRDANFTITVAYCGNGATLLWGAQPIFLSLDPLAGR